MTKKMPPKILVIARDNVLSTSICNIGERYWFNTIKSANLEDSTKLVISHQPNIVILGDDFEKDNIQNSIKDINDNSATPMPFLIICSKNITYNFKSPIIEYLKTPFTPYEIIGVVKSLVRKTSPIFQTKMLEYRNLTMNLANYKVSLCNNHIHLGPTEFKILHLLITDPNHAFSRIDITEHVWGKQYQINPRTIDVHINRIRRAFKNSGADDVVIKTVRDSGYCLE